MLQLITPIDGTVWFERPWSTAQEVETAVSRAVHAQRAWAQTDLMERQACIERFIGLLEARADVLGAELAYQVGRPVRYGPKELRTCAERARVMSRLAAGALAPVSGDAHPGERRFIQREALGVVLVIPAWNFPWLIAVNAVVPALLAGNAVVLKHSAQAARVGEAYQELLTESGVPEGVFRVLRLPHRETEALIGDPRIAFVAFTGSVKGGHEVVQAAAHRFIDMGLELGGKDPAYVRSDADLASMIPELVDGSFFNSGQSCCGIERIYVHRGLYLEFVEAFVEAVRGYRLGDPREPDTTLGPLARASHASWVRGEIDAALASGAKAWIPERLFPASQAGTAYLAPQVLTEVDHRMRIMRDETFGPVVGIMPVRDDEEAIGLMNDSPYGLTASVWTQDPEAALAIGQRLETGTFFMNRCDWLEPSLAWTGVKNSGRGCTLSPLGFERLTRPKSFNLRKALP